MEEVIIKGRPVIICPGCQKTTKKGNEFGKKKLCGFCYFEETFLRKSGNQDIDNFLRKFAEWKRYPFLEFIPYEDFSNGKFARFPPETVALKVLNDSQEMGSDLLKEDSEPSNRPEIEEIVRIMKEWRSNYHLQFNEAEEECQKIIKEGAP
ncbi:10308_t:CDS:2, partial [Acaulospora morrowiae]